MSSVPPAASTETSRPGESQSFDQVAAEYDRARPDYPAEVVRWIAPPPCGRVVDLGAGTGKLTRPLAELGHEVVALDHGAALLRTLRGASSATPVVRSAAERLPLATDAVDGVVVAQAWHWFDETRTVDEIARVLRPRGRLGLVWNMRDERRGWVRELAALLGPSRTLDQGAPSVDARFAPLDRYETTWSLPLTRERLVELVRSRSQVAVLPPDDREELIRAVHRLCDAHPDTAGRDVVSLHYRTIAYRTRLVA